MLIESPIERNRRRQQRHLQVLRFLRDETWTSPKILAQYLGCSPSSVTKTMSQLEQLGQVVRHVVPEVRQILWGITPHGLAFAWDDDEVMQVRPSFEPSRLALVAIAHHLVIQMARLNAEKQGWTGWVPGNRLPAGLAKRPDAVATDPQGNRIAIEVERHVKTLKRYEAVFAIYLQCIKRGDYAAVHYVCPDERMARKLVRVLGLIQAVPLLGDRVPIGDKHRARFPVFALDDWPSSGA